MSEENDSQDLVDNAFHGLEDEEEDAAGPTPKDDTKRVGKLEVYKLFMNKAVNAYFHIKFMVGNPKYKQVVQQHNVFRSLSILAKDYLVDKFTTTELTENQRILIPDVHDMEFFFVMEGRIAMKFHKERLYADDRHLDAPTEVTYPRHYLKVNDYLNKKKMKTFEDDSTLKLVALQCETLSAKIIRLPRSVYDDMANMGFLNKEELDSFLMTLSDMSKATDKAQQQFIKCFKLEFLPQGTVLAKEGINQHFTYILLDGDVLGYKELFHLQGASCEERDKERELVFQNQSKRHIHPKEPKKPVQEQYPTFGAKKPAVEEPSESNKKPVKESECVRYLSHLSAQSEQEQVRTLGQKLGYAPSRTYLCQESVLHSTPMEYSLTVASRRAVVLRVSKVHVTGQFPFDTKRELNRQSRVTIQWLKMRGDQCIKGGFAVFQADKKIQKLQQNNRTNYPASNRAGQKSMYTLDLIGPNEHNEAKFLTFRRMRLDKEDNQPALVQNKKWKPNQLPKNFTSPKKALDGYVSAKDMEQLQDIKDALYGGFNVDKHRANILDHRLAGIKGYPDTNVGEVESTMKELRRYNRQIDNVKSWVPQIDYQYFEKKRLSMLPEVRFEKRMEHAKVLPKASPLGYVPTEILQGSSRIPALEDCLKAKLDVDIGSITQESTIKLYASLSSVKANKKLVAYDQNRNNKAGYDSILHTNSLQEYQTGGTFNKRAHSMMIGKESQLSKIPAEQTSARFARKPGSMDNLSGQGNMLPSFAIQTPKHLLSPINGGTKKRIPWGGSNGMDVINTPSSPTVREHSSHARSFGVDYIAENLMKSYKNIPKGGRNEISMFKNTKSNQKNVTFYNDCAIALREGFRPSDQKIFSTAKEASENLNEESSKDLLQALLAVNAKKEKEAAGIAEKDQSIGPSPLQNEDVLARVGKNRHKLDSVVAKMYYHRKIQKTNQELEMGETYEADGYMKGDPFNDHLCSASNMQRQTPQEQMDAPDPYLQQLISEKTLPMIIKGSGSSYGNMLTEQDDNQLVFPQIRSRDQN